MKRKMKTQKALELFQKLYKKTPKMDYKENIEELKKELLENKKSIQIPSIAKETIQYNQDTDNIYEELHNQLEIIRITQEEQSKIINDTLAIISKKIRQLERNTN